MTYIPSNPNLDAFGRLRTSGTGNRLDVEFIYHKQPDFFDELLNGASASVTHLSDTRDLRLSVGSTTDGEYASMRSHPVPYTPGNSQLFEATGVLDLSNLGTGTVEVFLRSSISGAVTEETVKQTSWDALDTGIDWSFGQIFWIDFQSLKTGEIRFGLNTDGSFIQVAHIKGDNVRDSGYWQLPNLPVSYRIYNTATETIAEIAYGDEDNAVGFRYVITGADATASMKAICCTVKSEAGVSIQDLPGLPKSIDNATTTVTASTTLVPIISIRSRATFNGFDNHVIALPKSIFAEVDESVRLVLITDAVLTNASWVDVDTNGSSIEYDVSATAVSNGQEVFSNYLFASSAGGKGSVQTGAATSQSILGKSVLWYRDNSNSLTGVLTIAAIRTGATDSEVLAGIRWEEIL